MFHSLNQSLVKLHPHVLLIIEHNNMKCQCFTLLLSSFPLDPSIHQISNHMSILLGNNIKIYMQFLIRMFADALILHCKSFRLLGKQFTFAALITSSNEGKKKKNIYSNASIDANIKPLHSKLPVPAGVLTSEGQCPLSPTLRGAPNPTPKCVAISW